MTSHERRKQIYDLLKKSPGLNGSTIADNLGCRTRSEIGNHLLWLKRNGCVRREGVNINAAWYAIYGAEVPEPKAPGRAVTVGPRPRHKRGPVVCEYHKTHRRSALMCPRCLELSSEYFDRKTGKSKKKSLEELFPKIMGSGKPC